MDSCGSPVVALMVPHKEGCHHVYDGERYIYHWILLVVARLKSKHTYGTIDIACKFNVWKTKVDVLADFLHTVLMDVADAAREEGASLRVVLENAIDHGSTAPWLAQRLSDAVAGLSEHAKGAAQHIGVAGVLGILSGMVSVYEVYAGIDMDSVSLAAVPSFSLRGWLVVLDAVHAYAHGLKCRHANDPRKVRHAGRQDGESVERHHSHVISLLAIVAAAGIEEAKQITSMQARHIKETKFEGMADTILRRTMASRSALAACAVDLMQAVLELRATTSVAASASEAAARSGLHDSASQHETLRCVLRARPRACVCGAC